MTYLDHNATSLLRPEVREAMHAVDALALNASSVHAAGRKAKQMLENARREFAEHLSVFAHEIVFTASATEANNMLLRALAPSHRLLVAATEHPCILNTAQLLGGDIVAVDANGLIDLEMLDKKLQSLSGTPALVSVMLVNNETGVIQPVTEIAKIVHTHGAKLHTDAVQAFGKMPIDMGLLGVDYLTFSAHKIGGPVGFGALAMRDENGIIPLMTGGGQERGFRAGTENIPAIMGAAALLKNLDIPAQESQWKNLSGRSIAGIRQHCPQAMIYGESALRMSNTLMIGMPGMSSDTQLIHFDMRSIAVSAGSACSSGRIAPSHVLRAMGVPPEQAAQAIRISFGWNTSMADIDAFVDAWGALYNRRSNSAA